MKANNFAVRRLVANDASAVLGLLDGQSDDYGRFFSPLEHNERSIAEIIGSASHDVYSGIFWEGALICLFMLRGWDAGYDTPTFGLIVDEQHRGQKVLSVAQSVSSLVAKLNGSTRIMVKVHPENKAGTVGALRLGYVATDVEPTTGNIIYHLDL